MIGVEGVLHRALLDQRIPLCARMIGGCREWVTGVKGDA